MGYFKPIEVATNTWYIEEKLGVGAYLLIGEHTALLSDTCNGLVNIKRTVRKLTKKPVIVMNTHGHADHAGGNGPFKEVYIHEGDAHMLAPAWQKHQRKMFWGHAIKRYPYARFLLKLVELKFSFNKKATPITLPDGHVFDLGGRVVRTLHLPGHSPGSVILLDESTVSLYVGDAINPGLFLFFDGSPTPKQYAERLRSLTGLQGFEWLRAAHIKDPLPFHFIHDLAGFLDRVTIEKSRESDLPTDQTSPVLQYSEPVEGYAFSEMHVFYH